MAAPHLRQDGTNEIIGEIEQLIVEQGIAGKRQLQNGHARRVVTQDQRRRNAGRQTLQHGLRKRGDLADGGIDVDIGLKEYFDDSHAG